MKFGKKITDKLLMKYKITYQDMYVNDSNLIRKYVISKIKLL